MSYLRWIVLTTILTLLFTSTGVWLEARLHGEPVAMAEPESGPSQIVQVTVQVLITGAVQKPGLYRLPAGQKIRDLLAEAGGPTDVARLSALDLEAVLQAGQVIQVPTQAPPPSPRATRPPSARAAEKTAAATAKVSLNHASQADLDRLPGVGPALARRILDWRRDHGLFQRLEDLLQVKGIGPKKFARLRGCLTL